MTPGGLRAQYLIPHLMPKCECLSIHSSLSSARATSARDPANPAQTVLLPNGNTLPTAGTSTESFEEIFPCRAGSVTKLGPQISLFPVPIFGVNTFQPRDASNILEDFWLVVFGDAWGLLIKAVKTTRSYRAGLQSTRGLVVWTSLGPLPRWVPGSTARWAPGTTRLVPHGTWWREAQGLRWRSTRIGSYTYHVLCRGLLVRD
jgi:hypothetical protein